MGSSQKPKVATGTWRGDLKAGEVRGKRDSTVCTPTALNAEKMKPLLSTGKHSAGPSGGKNASVHSAAKYISSEKRGKNFHHVQGVRKYLNECNCKITCRRYPRAKQTVCFLVLGNTAHRSTPLEATLSAPLRKTRIQMLSFALSCTALLEKVEEPP